MITSRDLSAIPEPLRLRQRLLGLSVLDSLLNGFSIEFDFHPDWSSGVEAAIRDNGSGDILNVFFCQGGTLIKGFAHESYMSSYGDAPFEPQEVGGLQCFPGLLDGVPEALLPFCLDSEGGIESPTTVIWCLPEGTWRRGDFAWPEGSSVPEDPDLSGDLLRHLGMSADDYTLWAREYYGAESLERADVEAIFAGSVLTRELASRIQPEWRSTRTRLRQTGYPLDLGEFEDQEQEQEMTRALEAALTPIDIDRADAAVFQAIFNPGGDSQKSFVLVSINHADGIRMGPVRSRISEAKQQSGVQIYSEIKSSVEDVVYEWKYITDDADRLGHCIRHALRDLQFPAGGFIEYLGKRFEL